eukprot:TRINITY_DN12938_c0_g1_i1.p1 TRINITY_DN12938_c0_g1~~TRINITY_DN12938_c0_g1_i1.p1  ORF type:complete len:398 (-),score=56.16 TRINITY_DN12938_c0_g1_i1:101-1294(-)
MLSPADAQRAQQQHQQQPSIFQSVRESVSTYPPVSRWVGISLGVLCACTFALQLSAWEFCLDPLLRGYTWVSLLWRVFAHTWFHVSIFHLLANMLSFYYLGPICEKMMGSSCLILMILFFNTCGAVLEIVIAFLLAITSAPVGLSGCTLGFSGVLFGLLTVHCCFSTSLHRSIFGWFTVPTYLYPWIVLALIQLFWPGASLLGHVCGILSGKIFAAAYTRGYPTKIVTWTESLSFFSPVMGLEGWIKNANNPLANGSSIGDGILGGYSRLVDGVNGLLPSRGGSTPTTGGIGEVFASSPSSKGKSTPGSGSGLPDIKPQMAAAIAASKRAATHLSNTVKQSVSAGSGEDGGGGASAGDSRVVTAEQEERDIAIAIALSQQEANERQKMRPTTPETII